MLRRATIPALLAIATLAAACGSSGSASKTSSSAAAVPTTASDAGITLNVGDQANGLKTLLTADKALTGTPYTVKFDEFQGAAPLFQAMQGGSVDTGYAADLPTLQAISGGLPIKLVAAPQSDGSGVGIIVQGNSAIKTIADLKGKTIVVSSANGSIAQYLLANVLQEAGLKYTDVKVQFVLPTAAQAAFSSKQIDAWAIFTPYQDIAVQQGARLLVDGADGRTTGIGFVSASNTALGNAAKKAAIADFLKRLASAETYATTHRADYATSFASQNGVSAAVATAIVSHSATALVPVDASVVSKVQSVSDLMHNIGSLPTDVDVATFADTSAYPTASK